MNDLLLTFDTDWAPDQTINAVADILINERVRSTWFITHDSPAIKRLKNNPGLFELGIHPNFCPDSSQGKTVDEVMRYLFKLLPKAQLMRTHRLYQSWDLLKTIIGKYPIKGDFSIFLPETPFIQPHVLDLRNRFGGKIVRVPFFWEDDVEMCRKKPRWSLKKLANIKTPGLKIFNFHPTHVYLNTETFDRYEKAKIYYKNPKKFELFINQKSRGTKNMFLDILESIRNTKSSPPRLSDIIKKI
jgi:hypothetical protein